jgi:hypothetical protein
LQVRLPLPNPTEVGEATPVTDIGQLIVEHDPVMLKTPLAEQLYPTVPVYPATLQVRLPLP